MSLDLNPYSKFASYKLGDLYLNQMNYLTAENYYRRADDIPEALNAMAKVAADKKDYEAAKRLIRKAISKNPSLSILHENLAKLTLAPTQQGQNFWDFWNSTTRKRYFAIIMGIIASAIVIYAILLPILIGTNLPATDMAY